jgi:hypothetical protein
LSTSSTVALQSRRDQVDLRRVTQFEHDEKLVATVAGHGVFGVAVARSVDQIDVTTDCERHAG